MIDVYEDKNIKIELKKTMNEEEILAVAFWLLTINGHTIEISLEEPEEEINYLDNLGI